MLNSKDRAKLRSLANGLPAIFHLGKDGLNPELVQGIREALETRELIKIDLLQNCAEDVREVARIISERTHSEVVQVIGRKFVLYKKSNTKKGEPIL
ncbi:MAG: YhbY family RNA-binding protein [Defluviitaleaceae bacterium]|nr:YhbY family RNA-binding protein [Defluviitaleaceae bacterium]